jgi:hypothetical protein
MPPYKQNIFLLPCMNYTTFTCSTPTLPSLLAIKNHNLKTSNFITKTSHIQIATTRDNNSKKNKASHKKKKVTWIVQSSP